MNYNNLPIYKSALDFCVYIEIIVKWFEKYSKEVLFLIYRANCLEDKRETLCSLVEKCEESKMLIQIAKELKVFKSFKQFERTAKLCVSICKQSQAWYNHTCKHFAEVSR